MVTFEDYGMHCLGVTSESRASLGSYRSDHCGERQSHYLSGII
jgi:hypothetical protein